jgi:hypothetical protein
LNQFVIAENTAVLEDPGEAGVTQNVFTPFTPSLAQSAFVAHPAVVQVFVAVSHTWPPKLPSSLMICGVAPDELLQS